jgi:hypothetical protein
MEFKTKNKMLIPESSWGTCVWQTSEGIVASEPGVYLSMEGWIGDREVEKLMKEAAEYWLGKNDGKPKWISGARKVTNSEHDDQMERLLEGKIPDWQEEIRLAQSDNKKGGSK